MTFFPGEALSSCSIFVIFHYPFNWLSIKRHFHFPTIINYCSPSKPSNFNRKHPYSISFSKLNISTLLIVITLAKPEYLPCSQMLQTIIKSISWFRDLWKEKSKRIYLNTTILFPKPIISLEKRPMHPIKSCRGCTHAHNVHLHIAESKQNDPEFQN